MNPIWLLSPMSVGPSGVDHFVVICEVGTIAYGGSTSISFEATAPTTGGSVEILGGTVSDTPDPDEENNLATIMINIVLPAADLQVAITVVSGDDYGDSIVGTGTAVGYVALVMNNGPQRASNVRMQIAMPNTVTEADLDVVSAGCTFVSGSGATPSLLDCELGMIEVGGSHDVSFVLTMPSTPGVVLLRVYASGDETDSNDENNEARVSITVEQVQRATTTTLVCAPLVQVTGESITCTATVTDVDDAAGETVPTGRFHIDDGSFPFNCTNLQPVDERSASCTFSITGLGDFAAWLTAEYEGSDDHESSTSAPVSIEWELRATRLHSTAVHWRWMWAGRSSAW